MWAIIRIRGTVGVSPKTAKTLELLMLQKPHQLVLVDENSTVKNMVLKAQDYVTFGEIEKKTLSFLLEKRARTEGNKRLSPKKLKELKLNGFEELADALMNRKKELKEFGIKQVFRLNSPSKGFERAGIKKSFRVGGALGFRGKKINALLQKMM